MKLFVLVCISIFTPFILQATTLCSQNYTITIPQLQNQLWKLNKSESMVGAKIYHSEIKSALEISEVESVYFLGSGMTETYLVKFKNGFSSVFKPFPEFWVKRSRDKSYATNPTAEVLASELSVLWSIAKVPTTIFREINNVKGSLQLFVERNEESDEYLYSDDLNEIRIFDYIINNIDRRNDNLFYSKKNLIAIDNSQSFKLTPSLVSNEELIFILKNTNPMLLEMLKKINIQETMVISEKYIDKKNLNLMIDRIKNIQSLVNQLK